MTVLVQVPGSDNSFLTGRMSTFQIAITGDPIHKLKTGFFNQVVKKVQCVKRIFALSEKVKKNPLRLYSFLSFSFFYISTRFFQIYYLLAPLGKDCVPLAGKEHLSSEHAVSKIEGERENKKGIFFS